MAWYKNDELYKNFSRRGVSNSDIPNIFIDIILLLCEKQARKLFPRGIGAKSKDKKIHDFLWEFIQKNRLDEQCITIEILNAKYGATIITLDKIATSNIPILGYADPHLMSRVEKFFLTEKTATIYKYILRDAKTYPVMETWTENTVKRTWYHWQKELDTGQGIQVPLKEWDGLAIDTVKEVRHNLGCLPIAEMKNKQTYINPLRDIWNQKAELATWWPVRGLIKLAHHTLVQIWKNMVLVKPKIIAEMDADTKPFLKGDLSLLKDDLLLNLRTIGGDVAKGQDIKILQGELQIQEWFGGYKDIFDFIFLGAGFSPINDSSAMKTTSEIYANQELSSETVNLLKQLRLDQWFRVFDKALIIGQMWNGKGKRPYTLYIPQEENMNKSLELEQAMARINANLSNYILELAKINNCSEEEARILLEENIKINKEVHQKSAYKMEEEIEDEEEEENDK